VVILVNAYGWSLAETAAVLGITKSSVQTHLERGMASLRQSLGVTP
jgi:DNA-directed RNA polymerase specialized sigma24 family protein